jgi:Type II secretion system (T2SS), protein M subtype b
MKINGRIAAVAVGLLMASAGVLYPVNGSMKAARSDVATLQTALEADAGVHDQLVAARKSMEDVHEHVAALPFSLCPSTPDAEHEFEAQLMAQVEASGLHSVRMDRREDAHDARYPTLSMDLVVEGDAFALQKFLQALESQKYVTRITQLSVESGADVRRIDLQIAVMLEQKS